MRNYQPKYRWKLSKDQLKLLVYVYSFRFVTTDLLAEILQKDRSTLYERFNVLVSQGYLLKQYDSTYRIDRRPASYCLASAGIRALKGSEYVMETTLLQNYKNKSFTRQQIDDCLQLMRIRIALKKQYGDHFDIFTQYQLNREMYVRPTPLLSLRGKTDSIPDYLVDLIPAGTPTWQVKRRLTQHEEFADESDYTYPHILFIAGNNNTEKRIAQFTGELYDDFKVFTTTLERVLASKDAAIWQDPEISLDEDEYDKPERVGLPMKFREDEE